MTVMQGDGAVIWDWITLGFILLTALCIWYFTIVGRDGNSKRGEEGIEHYGEIEEGHAPLSKFLIYTCIGVAVWAVGYAITTGVYGLF